MSLGFLTESALLPSKAKAIRVDAKSLVDLRAVVFQKEQERKRRLERALHSDDDDDNDSSDKAPAGARGFGKYAKLRAKKARANDGEQIGRSSNRGVETRRKRDEAAHELVPDDDDDDAAWHRKSKTMLEKKAKMYDEMLQQGANSGGAECLVDFSAKQRAATRANSGNRLDDSSPPQQVEITDEFGRVRFVTRGSVEHTKFMQTHAAKEADSATTSGEMDAAAACSSDQHSGGSFVASQWEKRFNAQEKTYLQQVHEGVHQAKSALHDKKMRKQLRLEKLKRQAGGEQSASAAAPLNAHEEQVAAVQATEFLNQFGSLM